MCVSLASTPGGSTGFDASKQCHFSRCHRSSVRYTPAEGQLDAPLSTLPPPAPSVEWAAAPGWNGGGPSLAMIETRPPFPFHREISFSWPNPRTAGSPWPA